jgi:hypothetical protein
MKADSFSLARPVLPRIHSNRAKSPLSLLPGACLLGFRRGSARLLAALLVSSFGVPSPAASTLASDPLAGGQLAERIRSAMPATNSEIRGTLEIGHLQFPITCQVQVHTNEGDWETVYRTSATNQTPSAQLVIIHHRDAPTQYVYGGAPVLPEAADVPFAGSDFSLSELGLEFLHWPGQNQLKSETRLTRPCYVLESTNAAKDGIARIKSWIDQESLSPIYAEAYDRQGIKVKEFTLKGSSTKVENLGIVNKKTGSRSTIKLELRPRAVAP